MSAIEPTSTELWVQLERAKRDEATARMLNEVTQRALVQVRTERDALAVEVKALRATVEAMRAVIGGVQ